MVLQIISAKKTILAKLFHLLTGFIGEIRDQISIYDIYDKSDTALQYQTKW